MRILIAVNLFAIAFNIAAGAFIYGILTHNRSFTIVSTSASCDVLVANETATDKMLTAVGYSK